MIKHGLWFLLFPCFFATASRTTDSPFVGDWKLNPAKSTLTDRMKVESAGGNRYTFDFGGGAETIAVDGTDQATALYKDGTLSVANDAGTWKVIRKVHGRTTVSAVWNLSKDGTTLTDHFMGFNADGSPFTLNYVYKRTAAGSGFAGTWESTSMDATNYVIAFQIRPYQDTGLSFIDPATQFTGNVNFPADMVRPLNDRTVQLMHKSTDGGVTERMQLELSSDFKTLTIRPRSTAGSVPLVLVFDRQ